MQSGRWLAFALLFAARMTIAYQFQSLVSVGPLLVNLLPIDFATLGGLIGCYMLPGIALSMPGGMLDQYLGAKRTISIGLALMVVGVVAMTPRSLAWLFIGRLVSGSGAALLNVVLARTVSTWFRDDELPFVMGAFVASWPLGVALSLLSVPVATAAFGWNAVLVAAAVPSLVCVVVFLAAYSEQSDARSGPRALIPTISRRESFRAGVAGCIWGLYNVSYVVFVAALPEFFVTKGYGFLEAAAVASVLGWVLIVTLPIGGYFSQVFGRGYLLLSTCFIIIAASAACLALTDATFSSLTVLAGAVGLPAGLIMALPAQLLSPESRPGGMGIFFTIFYLAMATLPSLAGYLRQQTGSPAAPLLFGAATISLAILGVVILSRLRSLNDRAALQAT